MLHSLINPSKSYCNKNIRAQKYSPKIITSWLSRTNQIKWLYFSIILNSHSDRNAEDIILIFDNEMLQKRMAEKIVKNTPALKAFQ